MPYPPLEKAESILIVEGYGDQALLAEILEWQRGREDVYIKHFGGKGNFRTEAFEVFLRPDKLRVAKRIAVVADADADAAATATSLETRLSKITSQEVKNGAWTTGPPRIGLYVVPGDGRPGEIETLFWEAWSNDPANAAARGCIDAFLACMLVTGRKAESPDKGRIGALLSVLHDDDPRLGAAARSHKIDLGRPELAPLLGFLRDL
jgi:hypothetical protein